MITNVAFTIPGPPQGKGRARATKQGRMYTPAKTVAYESLIAMAAQRAIGPGSPLIGPLCVELDAVYAIPASWSKKRKADVLSGSVVPTTKPDLDNVVKAVGDGGNGILWADDSQIAVLIARKVYGEKPEVRVRVCICGGING